MDHLKEARLPALHMPLWSYEELKHNNRARPAEQRLSEELISERYNRCGGQVSLVFDDFNTFVRHNKFGLGQLCKEDLRVPIMNDVDRVVSEIFVGIDAHENYYMYQYRFFSKSIAKDLVETIKKERRSWDISKMIQERYGSVFSSMPGMMLEALSINEFKVSKTNFSLQSLDNPKREMSISIGDGLQCVDYNGHILKEITWDRSANAKLWIIQSSRFLYIDGLLLLPAQKLAVGLIFTSRKNQPVPRDAIDDLIQHCSLQFDGCQFILAFVVPGGTNYDSFERQHQIEIGSHRLYERSEEVACHQYKLKML